MGTSRIIKAVSRLSHRSNCLLKYTMDHAYGLKTPFRLRGCWSSNDGGNSDTGGLARLAVGLGLPSTARVRCLGCTFCRKYHAPSCYQPEPQSPRRARLETQKSHKFTWFMRAGTSNLPSKMRSIYGPKMMKKQDWPAPASVDPPLISQPTRNY